MPIARENSLRIPDYPTLCPKVRAYTQEIINNLEKSNLNTDSLIDALETFQLNIYYSGDKLDYTLAKIHVERLYKIIACVVSYCDKKSHQLEAYANLLYRCAELLIAGTSKHSVSSNKIQDKDNLLLQAALSLKTVSDALLPYKEHMSLDLTPYENMAEKCLDVAEKQFDATPGTQHLASINKRFLAAYKRYAGYEWSNEFVSEGFRQRVCELENKIRISYETELLAEQSSPSHNFWGLNLLANLFSTAPQKDKDNAAAYEPVNISYSGAGKNVAIICLKGNTATGPLPKKFSSGDESSNLHRRHPAEEKESDPSSPPLMQQLSSKY